MPRLRYLPPKEVVVADPAPKISFDVAMRYYERLQRYARELMGASARSPGRRWSLSTDGVGDADDLLQETYAKALTRWERFGARPRSGANVQAWLHRIMLNLWLQQERQTHRRVGKLIRCRSEVVQATTARATSSGEATRPELGHEDDARTGMGDPRRTTFMRVDPTLWCCDPREAITTRLDVDRALRTIEPDRRQLLEEIAAGEDRGAIAEREGVQRVTVDARVWRARAAMERALEMPPPA